ncbi:MAG: hypothetical protein JHC95_04170 [Solirubrobacteraceae bacterium]|nr:hypothetical protein [Solirubrobacteraceae bacterium]
MSTPPPSNPAPSPSAKPTPVWWIGAVVVALVLAVGGYAIGKSAGESSVKDEYAEGQPKYIAIYNRGAATGQTAGETAGEAAGEKSGVAQGEKAGFERGEARGKAAGLAAGQAQGREAGATEALGFSTWDTGAPYIVRVSESDTPQVPYVISHRTAFEPGKAYALCDGSTSNVCVTDDTGGE